MSTHYRTKTFLILSKKALREGFLREGEPCSVRR